jgi:secondary thiamine-phosphate synthase enzyme
MAVPIARQVTTGTAVSYSERYAIHTQGTAPAYFDLTDLACASVQRSGVQQGHLLATTAHTTCAIIVQENEPLLLADLSDRLRRFAAETEVYRHNDMDVRVVNVCGVDECANAHSHCQHALLGVSAVLPVHDGRLVLGRWQRILLVELDHARQRELSIQVDGLAVRIDAS